MTREFSVIIRATVQIDDTVIQSIDAKYDLPTPEAVAGHVGIGLLAGLSPAHLDGFGDMPADELASVHDVVVLVNENKGD